MKNFTLLLLCLTISFWSYSQCTSITGGNYGNLVAVNDGTVEAIVNDNWPNAEYSAIENLIIGNNYTVTGTNTTSIYITIAEIDWGAPALGGTVLGHGVSSVSFTATTTDVIIHWHLDALCNTQDSDDTVTTIQCTSCSCTAATAPDAATGPTPADGAVNVPINVTDPLDPFIAGFSWTDNGAATSYDWTLTGVGTAGGVTNPVDIFYDWAYNTTYSWSVTSTNCLGNITSATFSFTTEADPALSVDDNQIKLFSVFPNPFKDVITIDTNLTIESLTIDNQIGQRVMGIKQSDIINNEVNLSKLSTGLYFMNVSSQDKTQSIKIIKE